MHRRRCASPTHSLPPRGPPHPFMVKASSPDISSSSSSDTAHTSRHGDGQPSYRRRRRRLVAAATPRPPPTPSSTSSSSFSPHLTRFIPRMPHTCGGSGRRPSRAPAVTAAAVIAAAARIIVILLPQPSMPACLNRQRTGGRGGRAGGKRRAGEKVGEERGRPHSSHQR